MGSSSEILRACMLSVGLFCLLFLKCDISTVILEKGRKKTRIQEGKMKQDNISPYLAKT